MKSIAILFAASMLALSVSAKLPAPSDDAKAKAAEAAAKAAHAGKVADYQLCKAQDKAAAQYRNSARADKKLKPVSTAPCADPGAFKPAVAAPAAAPAAEAKKPKKS